MLKTEFLSCQKKHTQTYTQQTHSWHGSYRGVSTIHMVNCLCHPQCFCNSPDVPFWKKCRQLWQESKSAAKQDPDAYLESGDGIANCLVNELIRDLAWGMLVEHGVHQSDLGSAPSGLCFCGTVLWSQTHIFTGLSMCVPSAEQNPFSSQHNFVSKDLKYKESAQ